MNRVIRHTVTTPHFAAGLEKRLPAVRGRLTPNAPLRQHTWLNAGGPAEVMFKPADKQDLIDFIRACPADVPVTTLGVCSNIIIRDGGIPQKRLSLAGYADQRPVATNATAAGRSLNRRVDLVVVRKLVSG